MNKEDIPVPSAQVIDAYLNIWETSEDVKKYPLQEKALNFLFAEACPRNDDMTHVILKVSALNDFYSTNIFDTYSVAERILSIKDFNERLKNADYSLVNEIAQVTINGKTKNFYSFASKYCSHHRPDLFPIYDSYVEKMLLFYDKNTRFMTCKKLDLKNYQKFVSTIKGFQEAYKLEKFSLRDIDVFLWQVGKKYFPNTYGKKSKTVITGIKAEKSSKPTFAQFKKYRIMKQPSGTIELTYENREIVPVLPELRRLAGLLNLEINNRENNPYNTRQLGDMIIKFINKGSDQA